MKTQKISKLINLQTKSVAYSLAMLSLGTFVFQGCSSGAQSRSASVASGAAISNSSPAASGAGSITCPTEIDSNDLFSEVEMETSGDGLDTNLGSRTKRQRSVAVNIQQWQKALRPGSHFQVPLFSDRSVEIQIESVQNISPQNKVAVGRVIGQPLSAVTLVLKNDILIGNINLNSGLNSGLNAGDSAFASESSDSSGALGSSNDTEDKFEIRYTGSGVHRIRAEGEDLNSECLTVEDPDDSVAQVAEKGAGPEKVLATPVIDILGAYTPAARIAQGGKDAIEALIQMGVADTNRALADSGVVLSTRLVGLMELKQNESDYSPDIAALQGTKDGKWDEVHAERARLGADQVTVVGAYPINTGVAGIGFTNAKASSAFTIVKAAAFGMYTFSHELGHNLGLQHSDGFLSSPGNFRTIIAYGSYPRLRRYSNPKIPYKTFATGDSAHNEAAILNKNALRVSSLVATLVPPAVIPPVPGPTPVAVTPGVGAAPGLSGGSACATDSSSGSND
jgi:hypothetical protein